MRDPEQTTVTQDTEEVFNKLKPWVTKFTIDGVVYGGGFDALNDRRVAQFFQCYPDAQTIIELGSLEGGHTFALGTRPGVRSVVGIEGRKTNVEKARAVQKLLDIHNVEFVIKNLEDDDLASLGSFDAVFCVGLLYHLPRPWKLLERMARVSPNLFIWTHYAADDQADTIVEGYRGKAYREFGLADPLSGMSPESFWPTLNDLQTMLSRCGFAQIQIIEDKPGHSNGPSVIVTAAV